MRYINCMYQFKANLRTFLAEKSEAVAVLEKKVQELQDEFESRLKEKLAEQAEKVCMSYWFLLLTKRLPVTLKTRCCDRDHSLF